MDPAVNMNNPSDRERLFRTLRDKSRSVCYDFLKRELRVDKPYWDIPSATIESHVQEYFERIGLKRLYENPKNYKFHKEHLVHFEKTGEIHVTIMAGLLMKMDKETAEKILILGLP